MEGAHLNLIIVIGNLCKYHYPFNYNQIVHENKTFSDKYKRLCFSHSDVDFLSTSEQ